MASRTCRRSTRECSARARLSAHLVTVTLGGDLDGYAVDRHPGRVRARDDPAGRTTLVLPEIDDRWQFTYPEGAPEPAHRVYTISDHRIVEGQMQLDLDIALHDEGIGSDWARDCKPGDRVGLIQPHGLYAAPAGVGWQLLVADITGSARRRSHPAGARLPGQQAEVVIVLTDPADEIAAAERRRRQRHVAARRQGHRHRRCACRGGHLAGAARR